MPGSAKRPGAVARRTIGVLLAMLVVLAAAPSADAGLKERLQGAKARLSQLRDQIDKQQKVLDRLSAQAAVLAQRLDEAQARLDLITSQLMQTRGELDQARQQYEAIVGQLNERMRSTYMAGPGSSLEFLLGASSFSDLSDRLEYVDTIAQADADLATQAQNLKNELTAKARDEQRLRSQQAQMVLGLQQDQAALDAKFAEQKKIFDSIQAKKAEAVKLVHKLGKQYAQYLTSLSAVNIASSGVFRVCPVDQPRAVYDGFGAPRYAGGYHPHAGNDILAPLGTQIRAPFDGVAHSSYNGLGGNSEYVYGAQGYVYNAHLSSYSSLSNGPVHAGDVIGYVGNTGDAAGGPTHDHFEWHPKVIPSSWPDSPYGYNIIGTAVNPYPLLQQVC